MASPIGLLPLRFTNGIDTKGDELVQQKMAKLENGVFTRTGGLRKRNGYARSASPGSSLRAFKANDELLVTGFLGLNSRVLSPAAGWTPSKGRIDLGAVSEKTLNGASGTARGGDICASGNVVAVCWYAGADLVVSIYDAITGAQFVQGPLTVAGTPTFGIARFVLEGTVAKLWVVDFQGSRASYSWSFDLANPPTTLPSATAAWTPLGLIVAADIARQGGVTSFAYAAGTSIFLNNTTGYYTGGGATITAPANAQAIAIAVDTSTGNRHIIYATYDGTSSVVYLVGYNAAMSSQIYAPVTVETLTNKRVLNVGIAYGAGGLYVTYDVASIVGVATDACDLRGGFLSVANGTGSVASIAKFCNMASKVFYDGSFKIWAVYSDLAQVVGGNAPQPNASTLLLLELDVATGRVIARAHQEAASAWSNVGRTTEPSSVVTRTDSPSFYYMVARPKQAGVVPGSNAVTHVESVVSFDSGAPGTKHDASQFGLSLQLNGTFLQTYDGARVIEHGFHTPPRICNVVNPTTGGSLVNGSYLVSAVFAYTDANGEVHYSRPADVQTIVLSGGTSTQRITFQIRIPPLTLKAASAVNVIAFYSDLNGQVLYGSTGQLASTADANGYVSVNLTSIAGLTALPTIYTAGGVLRNDVLPACNFIAKAGDRLWGHVGQGVLWYSKKRTAGRSVEFSALQTYQLSSFLDPVAMVELDQYKVVFSQTAIAYFTGDGPNATGSGIFSDDTALEVDVGTIDYRTIVRTTMGVLFKSSKGYYLLDRGLGLTYIGADIEGYNAETVVAAESLLTRTQAKIALSGVGKPILVYDTLAQQWATEVIASNPSVLDIITWRGKLYLLEGSFIHEQQEGLYTDNSAAIVLRGRTGWLAPGKQQGLWYVKHLGILGQKKSNHRLIVVLRYDESETIVETFTIDAGGAVPVGPYQWRLTPKKQQCKTMSIEFYDDFTGYTPGEGFALSEISLEFGVEPGLARLPAAQTIKGA